ncbi:hypothetical protein OI70_00915 [Dickeya fangzhongdai]|nr:hypothetical protein OI70_00915 [Dickeya fangzhongdai]
MGSDMRKRHLALVIRQISFDLCSSTNTDDQLMVAITDMYMRQVVPMIISPSYFKLQVCWLPSLTPVTYLCKLPGIHSVAAFLQLELFWV